MEKLSFGKRTRALVLGLALGFWFGGAPQAQAAAIFSIDFAGSSTISVTAGTLVTVDLFLNVPGGEQIGSYAVSIVLGTANTGGAASSFPYGTLLAGPVPSEFATGQYGSFAGLALPLPSASVGTQLIGSVTFTANATSPVTIFLNSGIDGIDPAFQPAPVFIGGQLEVIPEPSTAVLVLLGIAGLAIARRPS